MLSHPMTKVRRVLLIAAALTATAGGITACGEQRISSSLTPEQHQAAELFVERCSGCHTLGIVGAEGGALKVKDRERVDGPNFNVRREDRNSVLYAIRNGGFSGAIMPQDIVVGRDAEAVADFMAKYSGGAPPATGGPGRRDIGRGSSGN